MVFKSLQLIISGALLTLTSIVVAHTPPDHARVYFENLKDGQVVNSPVLIKFGIKGFGITPAGTKRKIRHKAGHHHLLINLKQNPDLEAVIPRDANYLHFDKGETETILKLPKGKHTLQLLLGDEQHEPQEPPLLSEKITIIVE